MGYYIALDIGIASVGWAVVDEESNEVIETGVNIFPEANAASNAIRRGMRQAKRLSRRRRTRLDDFIKLWERLGKKAENASISNLPELKVKALTEKLEEQELFGVLYSALKHRGISYLEDAEDTDSGSEFAQALAVNQKEMEMKYPCQIQYDRLQKYGKFHGQNSVVMDDGNTLNINNVFTISAYRKEICAILETQKRYHDFIDDEFVDNYLLIFNRKRKYYEGPGNEQSRTDYGIYSTKIDSDTGRFITEKNIFEKLIGKCSVYPNELRGAAASYTAQEFNLLNDLNNITVNGRKLEKSEKEKIIETVRISDVVNMRKIIAASIHEKVVNQLTGARIDKNDKEIFHSFSSYNHMRKALRNIGRDINDFSHDELDEIGYILTINTDKESIIEAFRNSSLNIDEEIMNCLFDVRRKNSSEFSKWQSFSLLIMKELIPEMYDQPKEQMTLLTEMGVFRSKEDLYKDTKYIPVDIISDEMLNPVVRRSVRISFKIINALLKKYSDISEVVVEMPRDRNSDEEKDRINKAQKNNEKELKIIEGKLHEIYGVVVKKEDYLRQKQLGLKLKLWNEQDGKCLYSGNIIDPKDILLHPDMFEIDHIIPRSISYDDSRNNKVLVYSDENQKKGNQTPYYYFSYSNKCHISYEQFKASVIELSKKKEYGISRKKLQNLLFDKDITKIEVMQGFISRNLNDTRYASKVVLNTLQSYFKAKNAKTIVKVIRGSFTHQMRVNMNLNKNREESYSHHAVDAMLIAYSQMGYKAYHKLQGSFIDFETGEILDREMYSENMSDEVYKKYLYGEKWTTIHKNIVEAEKKVKYWYYIDKKCNRGLCNQTIRGSREYVGRIYKINKFDIRTKEGVALFKKLSSSEKERLRLLVYKNDPKTYEQLVKIFEEYGDSPNPFTQYEKETGDYVRKYAKNHNGSIIRNLKYTDGEVGSCIDVSHKYGFAKGSKKVILESLVPYRMDVYYKESEGKYYLIGLKHSDVKCEGGKYVIDEAAYSKTLLKEKIISEGQDRNSLIELGYSFVMSFYKNEFIEYEKDGEIYLERFLSRTMPNQRNYIETKPTDKAKYLNKDRNIVGLSRASSIKKIRCDILGNRYVCEQEKFSKEC